MKKICMRWSAAEKEPAKRQGLWAMAGGGRPFCQSGRGCALYRGHRQSAWWLHADRSTQPGIGRRAGLGVVSVTELMNWNGQHAAARRGASARLRVIHFAGGWCGVGFSGQCRAAGIAREIYQQGGVVCAVCHGAAGLLNIRLDDGSLLVEGKQMSCFSNLRGTGYPGWPGSCHFCRKTSWSTRCPLSQGSGTMGPVRAGGPACHHGQNPASTARVAELWRHARARARARR